ncbi:MAG: hypothetical protein JNL89_04800, partial [Rhodanobacteraceae bacterium]|nr:hypothetical protein [Rhodanobacteraceae bacterium]
PRRATPPRSIAAATGRALRGRRWSRHRGCAGCRRRDRPPHRCVAACGPSTSLRSRRRPPAGRLRGVPRWQGRGDAGSGSCRSGFQGHIERAFRAPPRGAIHCASRSCSRGVNLARMLARMRGIRNTRNPRLRPWCRSWWSSVAPASACRLTSAGISAQQLAQRGRILRSEGAAHDAAFRVEHQQQRRGRHTADSCQQAFVGLRDRHVGLHALCPGAECGHGIAHSDGKQRPGAMILMRQRIRHRQRLQTVTTRVLEQQQQQTEQTRDELKRSEGSIQGIAAIPEALRLVSRSAWELPRKALIGLAAARLPCIDQSQSLTLFLESPSIGQVSSMYMYAWKAGLKTSYYLRSRLATRIAKATLPALATAPHAALVRWLSRSHRGRSVDWRCRRSGRQTRRRSSDCCRRSDSANAPVRSPWWRARPVSRGRASPPRLRVPVAALPGSSGAGCRCPGPAPAGLA